MFKKAVACYLLSSCMSASHKKAVHVLDVVTTCKPVQTIIASYLESSYILHRSLDALLKPVCTYSPDLTQYARTHADLESIHIGNLKTGDLVQTLPPLKWSPNFAQTKKKFTWYLLLFSPNGKFLTTAGTAREIRVIAAAHTGDLYRGAEITEHGSEMPVFYTWDIQTGAYTDNVEQASNNTINAHYANLMGLNAPHAVAYTPDGTYMLASHAQALTIFEVVKEKNNVLTTLNTTQPITAIALSAHSHRIALAGGNLGNHEIISLGGHKYQKIIFTDACALAFSPDGKYLAVAQSNNSVQLYNIAPTEQFTHDQFLAVTAHGNTVQAEQLLDASGLYEQLATLTHDDLKPESLKHNLLFSKNGKYLACGIQLWKNQARNLKYKRTRTDSNSSCTIS